jgi:hypothetical protein
MDEIPTFVAQPLPSGMDQVFVFISSFSLLWINFVFCFFGFGLIGFFD